MSATEAEVKLCEEKHRAVDEKISSLKEESFRRLKDLEDDKKARDAAGWKSFGSVLLALLAAALAAYTTFVPKGVSP